MSFKTKYSTRRKYIRMSWNKVNIYNMLTFFRKFRKFKYKNLNRFYYKRKFVTKQLLRRYYGDINESQFYKTFKLAEKYKNGGKKNFFILLEHRLDSALFRINFAPSIYAVRQLINHGHILVNNRKVKTPSYLLNPEDLIQVKIKSFSFIRSRVLYIKSKARRKINQTRVRKRRIQKILKGKVKIKKDKGYIIKRKHWLLIPKYFMVNYKILSAIFIRSPKYKEIPYPFTLDKELLERYYKGL